MYWPFSCSERFCEEGGRENVAAFGAEYPVLGYEADWVPVGEGNPSLVPWVRWGGRKAEIRGVGLAIGLDSRHF